MGTFWRNKESLKDSQIAHPVHEPKVVGTARCAVTARKAGGTIRMRPAERRFMEWANVLLTVFKFKAVAQIYDHTSHSTP